MAKIDGGSSKTGLKKTTTWDTAADFTAAAVGQLIRNNGVQLAPTNSSENVQGDGNSIADVIVYEKGGNITINGDLTYEDLCWMLSSFVLGTAGAPVEQTSGEGDYLHTLVSASDVSGIYGTLAWLVETDQVIEIPSFKPTGLQLNFAVNQKATFSFTGTFGKWISSTVDTPTNTAAEVTALSYPTSSSQAVRLAGSAMYVRLADFSTSTALDSGDNQQVTGVEISLSRPSDAVRVTRGADSPFPLEPMQTGDTEVQIGLQYAEVDDAVHDVIGDFSAETTKMFELYTQGTAIGSGNKRDLKLQIGSMKAIDFSGYSPVRGSRINAGATYKAIVPDGTPASMSSATDLIAMLLTNERATNYLA